MPLSVDLQVRALEWDTLGTTGSAGRLANTLQTSSDRCSQGVTAHNGAESVRVVWLRLTAVGELCSLHICVYTPHPQLPHYFSATAAAHTKNAPHQPAAAQQQQQQGAGTALALENAALREELDRLKRRLPALGLLRRSGSSIGAGGQSASSAAAAASAAAVEQLASQLAQVMSVHAHVHEHACGAYIIAFVNVH